MKASGTSKDESVQVSEVAFPVCRTFLIACLAI